MSLHKLGCCCCVSYFPPLSDGNHASNRLHMHTPTGTCMDLPFLELFPSFFRDTVQDRPVLFHHVDKAKRPCYSNRFSAIDTISRTEISLFCLYTLGPSMATHYDDAPRSVRAEILHLWAIPAVTLMFCLCNSWVPD